MNVDVQDLIERLKDFKRRVQNDLDEDEDMLLAVTIAVLQSIDKEADE